MRMLFVCLAIGLSGPVFGDTPTGPFVPNQGLEIVQRFGGTAKMVVSSEMEAKEPPPLVITDQASFERFTSLLPSSNVDPLVKVPRFDWAKYMLLVVFDSQSLSFPPNVSRVEIRGDRLIAVVEYPDTKNLIEAKPPEIGSYGAALVLRNGRPLDWINPGHRAQEAQRQSMMMFLPKNGE